MLNKKIYITILLITLIPILVIFFFFLKDQLDYQRDLNYLNSLASQLGNTPQNQIFFHRDINHGIDFNYDNLWLAFTSRETLEKFTREVNKLRLNQQFYFPKLDNGKEIYDFNLNSNKHLNLGGCDDYSDNSVECNDYQIRPLVSEWTLGSKRGELKIQFSTSNINGDKWKYGNDILDGSVVVMKLSR